MNEPDTSIDWRLTTWEGSRRAQLRAALRLTVLERLQSVSDLVKAAREVASIARANQFPSIDPKVSDDKG